jgi:hypothetical protein
MKAVNWSYVNPAKRVDEILNPGSLDKQLTQARSDIKKIQEENAA